MNKKIRIVGTDKKPLQIIDGGENSYIVRNEEGSSTMVTERTSSPVRPIHCSELNKKIIARQWHKYDTKVLGSDGRLYTRFYDLEKPYGEIDSINSEHLVPQDEQFDRTRFFQLNENKGPFQIAEQQSEETSEQSEAVVSSTPATEDDINTLYHKLFGDMKENDISFYSLFNNVINIVDYAIPIDVIRLESSEYTDTVSLGEILSYSLAKTERCKVDLLINYSKDDNIYSRQISFNAFTYDGDGVKMDNIIEEINGDVQVEYIDGVIKVTPINMEVDECIIGRCTLLYGKC